MKTSRAFMVGGAAAALLTAGWALTPKSSGDVTYSAGDDSTDLGLTDDADGSTDSSGGGDLSLDDGSGSDLGDSTRPEAGGGAGGPGHGDRGAPPGGEGQDSGSLSEEDLSAGDSGTADGTTYTGASVQTRYGSFSVQITVVDGTVTGVSMVESGDSDHESLQINSVALPRLMQEVLDTQSADVSYISGASYTSDGFAQSVADAFDQAGL